MRIDLPFQERWRPRVLDGSKTTTVRTRRHGVAGDEFELAGATFVLTEVVALPLARARDRVWRDEGMVSPEEFERVWTANHATRGWRAADAVWVHRFRRVT